MIFRSAWFKGAQSDMMIMMNGLFNGTLAIIVISCGNFIFNDHNIDFLITNIMQHMNEWSVYFNNHFLSSIKRVEGSTGKGQQKTKRSPSYVIFFLHDHINRWDLHYFQMQRIIGTKQHLLMSRVIIYFLFLYTILTAAAMTGHILLYQCFNNNTNSSWLWLQLGQIISPFPS